MSMAEDLKSRVNQQKKDRSQKDELAGAFNGVSLKLIKQFIANVDSGAVQIDDVADLNRLVNIYFQINDIGTGEEGTGTLPSMAPTQKKLFEDKGMVVKNEALGEDEEDEEYVDLGTLSEMTSEDLEKMLTERETQVNNENEAIGE